MVRLIPGSLWAGPHCHACQVAEDDVGEVQQGHGGAAEEGDVYEDEKEAEAGEGGNEEEGPGRVQQD